MSGLKLINTIMSIYTIVTIISKILSFCLYYNNYYYYYYDDDDDGGDDGGDDK